ncbi:MAG: D-alanyl-D-alanine carboxypeptidase family protein [Bacilli bacterium]|nr:D-alanyl-D-alanine carboxypeptidase family protein [Bacilli bacterium]
MKNLITRIIMLTFLLILSLFIVIKDKNTEDSFIKKTEVEVNSTTNLYSLLNKSSNVMTDDYLIDTTELGKKNIVVLTKTGDEEINHEFIVSVVDTEKPIILGNKEIKTKVNEEIDLLKNVFVSDNYDKNLEVKIIGEYDFKTVGTYNLKYYVKDSSNNETYSNFSLIVDNNDEKYYITSKGYKLLIKDGVSSIDNIIIANKSYTLSSNYGNGLTSDTINNFNKMKNDASKEGLNLYIKSGYRSYYDQVIVYNNWVKRDGIELADTYSARAGHSEHQTGLAIDLNLINNSFKNTNEFNWLNQNAYKYGFILRYPENKQDITGYIYEPWHYRYVGVELAEKLYNNGNWITMEEYFGIDSKY